MLTYLFWPNPPVPSYDSPKVLALLLFCGALVTASMVFKQWRRRQSNSVTRKLTRSYSSLLFWFGVSGIFLTVSRVEGISYLSMRLWWVFWVALLLITVFVQVFLFRAKHYAVIPQGSRSEDPLEKYLPKKKRN